MLINLPECRTHIKFEEMFEYFFTKTNFPELVERNPNYGWEGLNTYKFIKFLQNNKIQGVNAGVDKLYSVAQLEELYKQIKSIDPEDWKSGNLSFLQS